MIYKVMEIKDSSAKFGMITMPAKKAVLQNKFDIKEVVIEKPTLNPNNAYRYDGQCPRNDWVRVGMKVRYYKDQDGDFIVKYNRKEEV